MELKISQVLNLKQHSSFSKHSNNHFHATFRSIRFKNHENKNYLWGKEEEENPAGKKLSKLSNPIQKHSKTTEEDEEREWDENEAPATLIQ